MIELYFDKSFIKKFQQRNDFNDPVISHFKNEFLKKLSGVKIFVNSDSLEELKELIVQNEFYELLSRINSPQILNFLPLFNQNDFFNKGSFSKIFFIESKQATLLQSKTGFLFLTNESLIEKWRLFANTLEEDELIIKSNPPAKEKGFFKSWDDLISISHPLNTMLVFDLYVLSNKTNQEIKNNLAPCIRSLLKSKPNIEITITIYSKELQKTTDWKIDAINEILKELPQEEKVKYSVVKYDDSKMIGDSEHNRFVLTNYFFIQTGAGFNVFKKNGTVNNSDTIRLDSLFKNKIRRIVKEKIANLNIYNSSLKERDQKVIGPNKFVTTYNYYPSLENRIFEPKSPLLALVSDLR